MSNYYHNEDYYKGYQNGWEDGSQRRSGYANTGFFIGICTGITAAFLILTIVAAIR